LKIDATSSVELIGRNTVDSKFSSGLFTQQGSSGEAGTGNAGNLTINTPLLRVLNGASVSASTSGAGQGRDLNIDTGNGRIEVIGTSSSGSRSSINAQSNLRATGAAGNLTIKTGELIALDGGQVSASTFGTGQGGDLTIDANKIEVIGASGTPGNVIASSIVAETRENATGAAGNLTIKTGELIALDGGQVIIITDT
jgi:large exoprotein involved in heme utilization and adhesion